MEINENENFIYKSESYEVIGIAMEIHRILGSGFSEVVYKDALEYEFKKKNIGYAREKEYFVQYKDVILPHKFYADFVVADKIILEVKCKKNMIEDHYAQVLNYLSISKLKLGLLINFYDKSLQYKRIISN